MRQKAANQMTKKNFILYKGHTGWKIKTRLFGTLLVSLSAVAIAESAGTVDVHAATETPSSEISQSPVPAATKSSTLSKSSDSVTPAASTPAETGTPTTPAPTTPPATTQTPVVESEQVTEKAPADTPEQNVPAAKTPVVESTSVTPDTNAGQQYPVLTPGQQVDVSKVDGTDGTVKLTADQIKDHFKGTLVNNSANDSNSKQGLPKNTSNIPIGNDGSVALTSTTPHDFYNSFGELQSGQVTGHQAAHVSFEHDIDFSHDFSMTGALGIGNKTDGADGVGIIFAPGDPAYATHGGVGQKLGLGNLPNAFGFVYDNYHNEADDDGDAADPGTAAYFGWRTTDSSQYGLLQADTGADMTVAASSLTLNKSNPLNNFTMTYVASTQELTVSLGGHDFIRKISDTASGYSISIAASTGAQTNNYAARIDSFNYTPKTAQVDVSFKAPATTPLETETATTATPAHVTANIGDTVLVFSSVAAAQRAIAADPTINPNLVTVVPTDADGNVYVVDGSQASTKYISDDATASDGAYYSYVVTGAATQSASVPVSLTYKATVTPVDKDGNTISGLDPIEVNAVAGKSTVVEIPGFTPATVTIPAPTDGKTVNYNLTVDMSNSVAAGTTVTGDNPVVNPIAHYYTASGTTVDGQTVVKSTVKVGTNQSVTDALNSQISTDGATAGITSADYYWSTVANAVGTDSTDASAPQASTSILVPTKAKLDKLIKQATDNQAKADTEKAAAQDIYDKFVASPDITADQKAAAKSLLDSVNKVYDDLSKTNSDAVSSLTAAEASTDPATIVKDSQDAYAGIKGMDTSLSDFTNDVNNMATTNAATQASMVSFKSWSQVYGTSLENPEAAFGSGFSTVPVTAAQLAGLFANPDNFYYVDALDSDTAVTPENVGVYYFKLTEAGRSYVKGLTPDNPNAGLYVSATVTITPAAAAPTIQDASVIYGGNDGHLPEITGSLGTKVTGADDVLAQKDYEVVDNTTEKVVSVDQLQAGGDYTIRYTADAQADLKKDTNYTFG
ncbi:lectin-like domain-containing protein, partial [Levilactobacillus andaensis]|uniref:lectin-like domain-containing protein n=1 Tax=Levilactobacillus andaensis TaxID=2799570 RepID=UPI001940A3D2